MITKKHWIGAAALVLALTLSGCGTTRPETGRVTVQTQPARTEAATEVTEAPENPLSLGRLEGGSYRNSYGGFGCDLDENWVFFSAEELQEMPQAILDAMEGSEIEAQMESLTQLMDMKADNARDLTSMNVVYSKLDMSSRLAYKLLSEEEIVDATLDQKDMLIEAYTQAGIENAEIEKVQLTFLGEDHWGLKTHAAIQGTDYYVLQVFNYHAGSYGLTISCSSLVEDNTQAVLDLFYPVA